VQDDMKKLIAYSSVAHMAFVTLGIFISLALVRNYANADAARLGIQGAMVQMISHGFVSGAMFSCIGVLYDRLHSRMIKDYGGVLNVMPWFGGLFIFFSMANCGLPGTSGFVGEFMVILGTIQVNFWYAALAATTLIFGAAYTLWMYKRVVFGKIANDHVAELHDINSREFLVLLVLAVLVLGMGIYPLPVTEVMHASVENLLAHVAHSKLIP
jgi:NADH-quinone oxidoreductase subunit M